MDPLATPWLVVAALVAIPVGVAAFFGVMVFRRMTPLVFACQRCQRSFVRRPHRGFPRRCSRCGARDWNA